MFEEPSEAEQQDEEGLVNHISPQGVPEPNSVSTALRMVSNSSLENTVGLRVLQRSGRGS